MYAVNTITKNNILDILHNIQCKTFYDYRIIQIITRYINTKYEKEYTIHTRSKGLIQGSAISPVLSNLYLNLFDKWLESKKYLSYRYSDNIAFFATIRGFCKTLRGYNFLFADKVRTKFRNL